MARSTFDTLRNCCKKNIGKIFGVGYLSNSTFSYIDKGVFRKYVSRLVKEDFLYPISKGIYSIWKVDEMQMEGLDFIIMIAIAKVDSADKFREDMYKSKRKELQEIWNGDNYLDIANIVHFAPSACNTQLWIVESSVKELKVYRYRKEGKRGIMPKDKVIYYNQIDIGIFLCFLDLCLDKNCIDYNKNLYAEENPENENNLIEIYKIK